MFFCFRLTVWKYLSVYLLTQQGVSLLHPLFARPTRMRVQDKTYDPAHKRIVIKNAISFRASSVPLALS